MSGGSRSRLDRKTIPTQDFYPTPISRLAPIVKRFQSKPQYQDGEDDDDGDDGDGDGDDGDDGGDDGDNFLHLQLPDDAVPIDHRPL